MPPKSKALRAAAKRAAHARSAASPTAHAPGPAVSGASGSAPAPSRPSSSSVNPTTTTHDHVVGSGGPTAPPPSADDDENVHRVATQFVETVRVKLAERPATYKRVLNLIKHSFYNATPAPDVIATVRRLLPDAQDLHLDLELNLSTAQMYYRTGLMQPDGVGGLGDTLDRDDEPGAHAPMVPGSGSGAISASTALRTGTTGAPGGGPGAAARNGGPAGHHHVSTVDAQVAAWYRFFERVRKEFASRAHIYEEFEAAINSVRAKATTSDELINISARLFVNAEHLMDDLLPLVAQGPHPVPIACAIQEHLVNRPNDWALVMSVLERECHAPMSKEFARIKDVLYDAPHLYYRIKHALTMYQRPAGDGSFAHAVAASAASKPGPSSLGTGKAAIAAAAANGRGHNAVVKGKGASASAAAAKGTPAAGPPSSPATKAHGGIIEQTTPVPTQKQLKQQPSRKQPPPTAVAASPAAAPPPSTASSSAPLVGAAAVAPGGHPSPPTTPPPDKLPVPTTPATTIPVATTTTTSAASTKPSATAAATAPTSAVATMMADVAGKLVTKATIQQQQASAAAGQLLPPSVTLAMEGRIGDALYAAAAMLGKKQQLLLQQQQTGPSSAASSAAAVELGLLGGTGGERRRQPLRTPLRALAARGFFRLDDNVAALAQAGGDVEAAVTMYVDLIPFSFHTKNLDLERRVFSLSHPLRRRRSGAGASSDPPPMALLPPPAAPTSGPAVVSAT